MLCEFILSLRRPRSQKRRSFNYLIPLKASDACRVYDFGELRPPNAYGWKVQSTQVWIASVYEHFSRNRHPNEKRVAFSSSCRAPRFQKLSSQNTATRCFGLCVHRCGTEMVYYCSRDERVLLLLMFTCLRVLKKQAFLFSFHSSISRCLPIIYS